MTQRFIYQLPDILWINLEKSVDRRKYMETNLNNLNLKHTRINALDTSNLQSFCFDDTNNIQINNIKKDKQLACFFSHIKALEHFVNNKILGDYCLISEDDLSMETVKYWNKPFWDYINDAPKDFEVIQLVQTYTTINGLTKLNKYNILNMKKHTFDKGVPWGCVLYLVKRTFAEKIISDFIKKDNFGRYNINYIRETSNKVIDEMQISNQFKTKIKNNLLISDVFMYIFSNAYTIPLFTTTNKFESTIDDVTKQYHFISKNYITQLLIEQKKNNLKNIKGGHTFLM